MNIKIQKFLSGQKKQFSPPHFAESLLSSVEIDINKILLGA